MTDRATLLRLAERVEKGEANTMALSEEIYRATGLAYGEHHYLLPGELAAVFMRDLVRSIDAQEALGADICAVIHARRPNGKWDMWHVEAIISGVRASGARGCAPTEARARLAAILRAIAAREEGR